MISMFFKDTLSPIYNMSRYQSEMRQEIILKKYDFKLDSNSKVLDLCCGSGQYRYYFKNQHYFGVDKFDNDFAKKKIDKDKFFVQDAENLQFENEYFDFLFCAAGLEHVRNKEKVAKELTRVMKKGTYAFISVLSKISKVFDIPRILYCKMSGQRYWGHGHHYYSKKDLKELFKKNNLEIIKFYPETGFFATVWLTMEKWAKTIINIFGGITNKLVKTKNIDKSKLTNKPDVVKNKLDNDFDLRDDLHKKIDYYDLKINKSDPSKEEYGMIGKFITRIFFLFDYYFPIPIVSAWIVIVKKPS
jgi:ubiquinone/menaquinone biosynthesis C-methylase UbiE